MRASNPAEKSGFVKICGLQDTGNAVVAARAGADALGFVLARSRRQVEHSLVVQVRAQLATLSLDPRLVVVVANAAEGALRTIVESARPDVVQLSGDESPDVLDTVGTPVFRSIRLPHGFSFDQGRRKVDPWFDHERPVEAVLIEADVTGQYGGTGTIADWELAARLSELYPVILAGGLTPANVDRGIESVHPFGVDVSSGVEVGGSKEPESIRHFIERARNGFLPHSVGLASTTPFSPGITAPRPSSPRTHKPS